MLPFFLTITWCWQIGFTELRHTDPSLVPLTINLSWRQLRSKYKLLAFSPLSKSSTHIYRSILSSLQRKGLGTTQYPISLEIAQGDIHITNLTNQFSYHLFTCMFCHPWKSKTAFPVLSFLHKHCSVLKMLCKPEIQAAPLSYSFSQGFSYAYLRYMCQYTFLFSSCLLSQGLSQEVRRVKVNLFFLPYTKLGVQFCSKTAARGIPVSWTQLCTHSTHKAVPQPSFQWPLWKFQTLKSNSSSRQEPSSMLRFSSGPSSQGNHVGIIPQPKKQPDPDLIEKILSPCT